MPQTLPRLEAKDVLDILKCCPSGTMGPVPLVPTPPHAHCPHFYQLTLGLLVRLGPWHRRMTEYCNKNYPLPSYVPKADKHIFVFPQRTDDASATDVLWVRNRHMMFLQRPDVVSTTDKWLFCNRHDVSATDIPKLAIWWRRWWWWTKLLGAERYGPKC